MVDTDNKTPLFFDKGNEICKYLIRLHHFYFLSVPVLLSLIIGSELGEENEMNKIILNLFLSFD